MSSAEVRYKLKRPVLVYVLAFCFIGAPIGNVLASMISFGAGHWYSPSAVAIFVERIGWVDRVWLSLTIVAGVALLYQRKWSWLVAIGSLVVASLFNLYYGLRLSSSLSRNAHFFPILFSLSNFGVIAVLYHFRFPFLDRREAWWGVAPRFSCHIPVSTTAFSGTITNISRTGAFVQVPGPSPLAGEMVKIQFANISGLEGEIVHASEKGCGVEFAPTREQKRMIKRYIKELSLKPMGELVSPIERTS